MNDKTVYYKPLPPKPATLMILEPGANVRMVSLDGDMRVGRDVPGSTADIRINSAIVSRDHGEFIYADNSYHYKDNGSLNGTYFNGVLMRKINERGSRALRLSDGDILRIDRHNLSIPHPDAVIAIFSTSFNINEQWYRYDLSGQIQVPIGRNIECGISLTDFMASRNHAFLQMQMDGRWKIIDTGSTNGVAVNKNLINGEQVLNPFDIIKIANTSLIFLGNEIIFNVVRTNTEKLDYNNRSVVMNVGIEDVKVRRHGSLGKKTLLRNIHLDIESGDFILILGGSGAGKTTFLRALLGQYRANGKIMLGDMDLYKNFKMLKHKIGIVEQFSSTRDNDTVYHTIEDAALSKLAGDYSNDEIHQRVEDIIKRMMLTSLRNNLIKNLSGGQKKRVEVAIQAIGDQEIFILDEPDSGMDFASRVDLMENLKSCTESGGVVSVISHSPDDAADMFTKVIVLAKSQSDEVGHLAFYGDVPNALKFFGVNKLSEIVMEINYEGGKGRADEFINKFEATRRC